MGLKGQVISKGNTVEKHINTAYDVVKSVANELVAIKKIGTDVILADIALIGDEIENGNIDAAIAAAISTAADLIATNADVVTTTADAISATADALEAQHWANYPEDALVPEGDLVDDYSAYHWMKKAQTIATGTLIYQGDWDASGGVYPSAPVLGHFYKISVAGTITPYTLAIGDSIIYNGTTWDKIDNTEQVTSVAGYVGAVTIAQILVALKTVDGSGSGLDADLLGGAASAAYALLASPALTGNPTAPTQSPGNNSTRIATTAFVLANATGSSWVHVKRNTSLVVADATYTNVTWETAVYDPNSDWNSGDAIIVPAGVSAIIVTMKGQWFDSSVGSREIGLAVGPSGAPVNSPYTRNYTPNASNFTYQELTTGIIPVSENYYIRMRVIQSSGGNLQLRAGAGLFMSVQFIP